MEDRSRVGGEGDRETVNGSVRPEENGFSAFRQLVNLSPEGILVHRNGTILYLNHSGARMLDYDDPAALIGKDVATVVTAGSRSGERSPSTLPAEESFLRRDGSVLPVEVVSSTATRGRVPIKFDFFRDVTDRKRMVDSLQRQKLHFEELFKNSPEAIVLFDAENRITEVNWNFTALFGYTLEEAVSKSARELIVPPDGQDEALMFFNRSIRGEPIYQETVRCDKYGKRFYVSILGAPILRGGELIGTYGIYRDINERKHTERMQQVLYRISETSARARDVSELYSSLHELVAELINIRNFFIAILDPATDTIEFPYFVDEHEPPPAPRHRGRGLTEYVMRTGIPMLVDRERIAAMVRDGEIDPLGTAVIDWLGVPLKNARGETFGVLGVLSYSEDLRFTMDEKDLLTFVSQQIAQGLERRRTEETLRATELQFLHLQRMETIGTLVGSLVHDYNNILAAIMGNAQLLEFALEREGSPHLKHVRAILQGAENSATLVKQLLGFSKKREQRAESIHLSRLVADFSEILNQVVGERVTLETRLSADLPLCAGEPDKIRQVLMNLVVNARDAMAEGGKISLASGCLRSGGGEPVVGATLPRGDWVWLKVRDTGCGMTPEVAEKAFTPFFTTKGEGRGTGLGLSIVRRIVDQHGGYIAISSVPGQGTEMIVYLPVASGGRESAREIVEEVELGNGEDILVVEDDPAVRGVLRSLLEDHLHYRVTEAVNGVQAQLILPRRRFDLVLSDIRMPECDGIKLLAAIRDKHPRLLGRVIALTAYSEFDDQALLDAGFAAVVKKPVQLARLSFCLRKVLGATEIER